MSDQRNGGIAWTDQTWNPIRGCSHVSPGCDHCYAERQAARFCFTRGPYSGLVEAGRWNGRVRLVDHHLADPLRWRKPRRIFVNSMSDLFHPYVSDEWLDRIFAVMACCPQHTFQVLTKRPRRMMDYLGKPYRLDDIYDHWCEFSGGPMEAEAWPLPNVWMGVTAENQAEADRRIPLLLQTPAAVRWVSVEPMLGPVNILQACDTTIYPGGVLEVPAVDGVGKWLHWVVCGGESGPKARPMHPDWARSLRDQCQAAGVPFFFKQWGEWCPPDQFPDATFAAWDVEHGTENGIDRSRPWRIGKHAAGRLLDGREWLQMPEVLA